MTPFDRYPGRGRELLEPCSGSDETCRNGYGRRVFEVCGTNCAYCDRDLGSDYVSWINISVDHVIPRSTPWATRFSGWVGNTANLVTCCRACNEFLKQFRIDDMPPRNLQSFFEIRDRVYHEKREYAQRRHELERRRYEEWHGEKRLAA